MPPFDLSQRYSILASGKQRQTIRPKHSFAKMYRAGSDALKAEQIEIWRPSLSDFGFMQWLTAQIKNRSLA
jgi:hypothetical protein